MLHLLPADLILKTIYHELESVSHKWFEIGNQLGIPCHILHQFAKEDDQLLSVVDYWVKGNVVDPVVPVSWRSIVEALKAGCVGETGLAEIINKKYYPKVEIGQILTFPTSDLTL